MWLVVSASSGVKQRFFERFWGLGSVDRCRQGSETHSELDDAGIRRPCKPFISLSSGSTIIRCFRLPDIFLIV
ncbi:hypothetical protein SUGI_1088460 [Cryptomeria japonica]|nr:hypothetical protein SUGI_1088460 [Cryptomeria japonica]